MGAGLSERTIPPFFCLRDSPGTDFYRGDPPGVIPGIFENGDRLSKGPWKRKKSSSGEPNDELDKPGAAEAPEKENEEDEVKAWHAAIDSTLLWRQEKERSFRWEQYVKHYRGDWSDVTQSTQIPVPPINLIFSYVKTEIAKLYFRDPWITVNAKKMEDIGRAQVAEQLLNYAWGELNLKQEIKLALRDALIVGHGWVKLGYAAEFGTVESQPNEAEGSSKEVMPSEYIKSENVFSYYVPWRDVIFSPDAMRPPHDARWMAFKIVKPLRAVKESGIYENTEDLKPSSDPKEERQNNLKAISNVVLWEIWDPRSPQGLYRRQRARQISARDRVAL
jgi:hypothetical protein